MVIIEKKAWPDLFDAVLCGKKKFDLRLGDREYAEGDILLLKEYNPDTKKFTGRTLKKKIKFVLKTKDLHFWDKKSIDKYGYVVLSLD